MEQLRPWWSYQQSCALGVHVVNMYGITETTVHVTYRALSVGQTGASVIGKQLSDFQAYVLDRNMLVVPVGVVGELYVGGGGVARGYLNNEDLTRQRFVENPFGEGRLYKTGDLVRWTSSGELEYIGRNDEQVKIRGYRVEPAEIEEALSKIEGIAQCCVVVKERSTESGVNKYLVGYYVSRDGSVEQEQIFSKLSEILPEHMIPTALVELESFPLTINGKLDKRALPDPDLTSSEEYIAPVSSIEKTLSSIWTALLGLDRVGTRDNFFRIGGNSILAIQLSHRMSKELGRHISVADIFKHKTIERLAANSGASSLITIPKVSSDSGVLSFSQERLWFIEQYEQGTNAYHMPSVFELGADADVNGIKYAIGQVVERHEVLRSTIESGPDGMGMQVVKDEPVRIEECSVADRVSLEALLHEDVNRPFDLGVSYPIRVKIYHLREEAGGEEGAEVKVVLINLHHIASDGWSMDIFHREMVLFYESYVRGDRDAQAPVLSIQYKDYAQWQRSYLTGSRLEEQLSYWKEKLSGYQPLSLPLDHARPSQVNYRGALKGFSIPSDVSARLRRLSRDQGVTLHSVLLSGLSILLGKYSGQQDVVTGSPIANRHHGQTQDLIGFFVNTLVNRTRLMNGQRFSDLLRQVHHDQVLSQQHQDVPFEKLVEELGGDRDPSRHPIFQVMFAVQSFGRRDSGTVRSFTTSSSVYQVEKFDLSIFIDDSAEELVGQVSYATSLYSSWRIDRLIVHYVNLIEALSQDAEGYYSSLNFLQPSEYTQVVSTWNSTDKPWSKEKTIHEMFQHQARRSPDAIALE
jgi:hypothetical protein